MQFHKYIDRFLAGFCVILMSTLVINVVYQVVARYVFNAPSTKIDGLTSIIFMWLILMGGTYTAGQHQHLSIEIFKDWLAPKNKKYLTLFIATIALVFGGLFLIYGGYGMIARAARIGQTSSAIGIDMKYIYLALPLSGICLIYYSLFDIFYVFKQKYIPNNPNEQEI